MPTPICNVNLLLKRYRLIKGSQHRFVIGRSLLTSSTCVLVQVTRIDEDSALVQSTWISATLKKNCWSKTAGEKWIVDVLGRASSSTLKDLRKSNEVRGSSGSTDSK